MPQYELVLLLDEEEEIKNIKELLKSLSGKLLEEKPWGKKTLSYAIKKNTSAYFYEWKAELEQKKISEFKRKLSFNDKILRYLLLNQEN